MRGVALSRPGLDADAVELTIKNLLSHLITGEFKSPADSLRTTPYVSVSSPTRVRRPYGM
eukprot:5914070-Pyramimonas_sp.AAC.1